jgi:hypothetical protein
MEPKAGFVAPGGFAVFVEAGFSPALAPIQ